MQEKIGHIAREFLQETSCFLVEVQEKNDRITVLLGGFNGVDIRFCSRLARHINRLSEEDTEIGKYAIEVSSVGVGSDINQPNQLKANVGRLVKYKDNEHNSYEGRLIAANNEAVCISDKKEIKWLSRQEINSIKVEIEF